MLYIMFILCHFILLYSRLDWFIGWLIHKPQRIKGKSIRNWAGLDEERQRLWNLYDDKGKQRNNTRTPLLFSNCWWTTNLPSNLFLKNEQNHSRPTFSQASHKITYVRTSFASASRQFEIDYRYYVRLWWDESWNPRNAWMMNWHGCLWKVCVRLCCLATTQARHMNQKL